MTLTLIVSKQDWEWHKRKLDADEKYEHEHKGEPQKYPCKVESEWGDDLNGPYFYRHQFFYQEEKTCEACGHKHTEWQAPPT